MLSANPSHLLHPGQVAGRNCFTTVTVICSHKSKPVRIACCFTQLRDTASPDTIQSTDCTYLLRLVHHASLMRACQGTLAISDGLPPDHTKKLPGSHHLRQCLPRAPTAFHLTAGSTASKSRRGGQRTSPCLMASHLTSPSLRSSSLISGMNRIVTRAPNPAAPAPK